MADCINSALITVESHLDHVERFLLGVSSTGQPNTHKLRYTGVYSIDTEDDEPVYEG